MILIQYSYCVSKYRTVLLFLAWITAIIFLQAPGVISTDSIGARTAGGSRWRRSVADSDRGGEFIYADINSTVILPCRVSLSANESTDSPLTLSATQHQWQQRWFKGGLPLETNSSSIASFTREDVGDYSCLVTDSFGSMLGAVIKLRVAGYIPLIFEKTSFTVALGDSLRLACPVKAWTPLPTNIVWYKDSQPIISLFQRTLLPNGVLHLTNLTAEDAGIYHCAAAVVNGSLVSSHNLVTISVDATAERAYKILETPPARVDSVADETVVLECFINSAHGETVLWEEKDMLSDIGEWKAVQVSSQLSIKANQYMSRRSVRLDVGGDYRCSILSARGDTLASYPTTITVGSSPYFTSSKGISSPESQISKGGITFNMDCDVRGDPQVTRIWLKNGAAVSNCYNSRVVNGSLKLEHVSKNESAYYQCIASNKYGTTSRSYKLTIGEKDAPEVMSIITKAEFTRPEFVSLSWETRTNKPSRSILAFNIVFSRDVCDPNIVTLSKLITLTDARCKDCGNNKCDCSAEIEVELDSTNYRFQVVAFSGSNGLPSAPVTAVAEVTTDRPPTYEPLNITAQDFNSVIIVRWKLKSGSSGYRVTTQYQTPGGLLNADVKERSNDQDYAVLDGITSNSTLYIEVEAVHEPIIYRERKVLNITRPFTHKRRDLFSAPAVTVIGGIRDGPDAPSGIIAFWTESVPSNYSYVWYRCDDRENFVRTSESSLTVSSVDSRCTLVVAPVLLDTPLVAAVVSYERWCRRIATPRNVTVAPHHDVEVVATGKSALYAVLVKWNVDLLTNKTCEVNYLVRWKLRDFPVFPESNSLTVQEGSQVVVKGLAADYTYNFQVVAFTNVSDVTKYSPVASYTVGPPLNAKNLAVRLEDFPQRTVVSWNRDLSGHDITLYVVILYVKSRGDQWKSINSTTLKVIPGVSLKVEYFLLNYETTYNVTVSSINLQGAGGVASTKFSTPSLSTVPATSDYTTAGGVTSTSKVQLSETQLAIIIASTISSIIICVSVSLCIVFHIRFKKQERRQRRRQNRYPRSTRLHTFTNHQPLIVNTNPPLQYEMSASIGSNTLSSHLLVRDDHTETSLPHLGALSSPLQPSIKATSGKDSGIYGGADDHQSSQDLGEYDVEADELRNSSLSLSLSATSSSQSNSGIRWSCEDCCTTNALSRSARAHTESESDSLLTDSNRPSKKQSDIKFRPRSADFHHSGKLRATDYFTLDTKPPDDENHLCLCSTTPPLTMCDSKTAS